MGNSVERIERFAFSHCPFIKNIRLSRALQYIDEHAFYYCCSIDCLFIPPNVGEIQGKIFTACRDMKILVLPTNIDLNQIGIRIVGGCHALLTDDTLHQYKGDTAEDCLPVHTKMNVSMGTLTPNFTSIKSPKHERIRKQELT